MSVVRSVPTALKPYTFHGLDLDWKEGDANALCDCPWCGKERKFSVKVEDGRSKCWSCGGGDGTDGKNAISWLRLLWERSLLRTDEKALATLAAERGLLDPATLTAWGVCRSVLTGDWLVPAFDISGKLHQLHRYLLDRKSGKRLLLPTPDLWPEGKKLGLFGVNLYEAKKERVALCEGPWDAMALWEVLRQAKTSGTGLSLTGAEASSLYADTNVLAVPGCGIFNPEWASLLGGKCVMVLYDSDVPPTNNGVVHVPAGWAGTRKVVEMMATCPLQPKEVSVLCWGEAGYDPELKPGYDLRDALTAGGGGEVRGRISALQEVLSRVVPAPTDWVTKREIIKQGSAGEIRPLPCTSWADLLNSWRKALRMRQSLEDVLATMLAVCASTSQSGDNQLFLMVVASPGCLHRDTPIHDPVDRTTKTVEERYLLGQPFNVWSILDSHGEVGIRSALPPHKFSKERMFRVSLESGRTVTVTASHRVWTGGSKYVCVSDFASTDLESFAYRLPSSSEHDLSTHVSGGQSFCRTVVDSQSGYRPSPSSCDGQLLSGAGNARCDSPLPDDVQTRNQHCSHKDDLPLEGIHIHHDQHAFRPSTKDYQLRETLLQPLPLQPSSVELLHDGGTPLQFLQHIPDEQRYQPLKSLVCTDHRSSLVSLYSSVEAGVLPDQLSSGQSLHRTPRFRSASLSPLPNDPPCTSESRGAEQNQGVSPASESPIKGIRGTRYIVGDSDRVVKVEEVEPDEYFDFHVPGTLNYWAEGLFHHNSAKTRFCDALLVSKHCFALEQLTGFHSGYKDPSGEDFSILSVCNHKTLITPEADVIMSNANYGVIMSEVRRIFDGTSQAKFKNRKEEMKYAGLRTPWIIAGTQKLLDKDQSQLGDRFFKIFMDQPSRDERRAILRRVAFTSMQSVKTTATTDPHSILDANLLEAYCKTGGYVDWLRANVADKLNDLAMDNEDEVADAMCDFGELTAFLRARPSQDGHKRIETHDAKELPSRLTGQYSRIASCLAVVLNRSSIDAEVLQIVRKIALDTAAGKTRQMIGVMLAEQGVRVASGLQPGIRASTLAHRCGLSATKTGDLLTFLRTVGAVECYATVQTKREAGGLTLYRLTSDLKEIWEKVLGNGKTD